MSMNEQPGHYFERLIETVDVPRDQSFSSNDNLAHLKEFIIESRTAPRFFLPDGGFAMPVRGGKLFDVYFDQTTHPRIPYARTVLEFRDPPFQFILILNETADGEVCQVLPFVATSDPSKSHRWTSMIATIQFRYDGQMDIDEIYCDARTGQGWKDMPQDAKTTAIVILEHVVNFLLALGCSNVEIGRLPISASLNKKRVRHGKLPFSDYHVLVIRPMRSTQHNTTGTHASPCQHLRRGHIRRLDEHRTVWVNQCIVGSSEHGVVDKDYRLMTIPTTV